MRCGAQQAYRRHRRQWPVPSARPTCCVEHAAKSWEFVELVVGERPCREEIGAGVRVGEQRVAGRAGYNRRLAAGG